MPDEAKCKRPACNAPGDVRLGDYCSVECETYHLDEIEINELKAEVERLRDDNHALQAEIILTLEQHERIREAVARHRVQILDGGHPLTEDVTLWAVLDA